MFKQLRKISNSLMDPLTAPIFFGLMEGIHGQTDSRIIFLDLAIQIKNVSREFHIN